MLILAVETSCDDTSIAIISAPDRGGREFKVLANLVSSQTRIHRKWGGVVPTLASRAHFKNLPIVFKNALKKAGLKMTDIDSIALTVGPGLAPSLVAGVQFARALAFKYDKPIIPVNHIEGHIYSNFLQKDSKSPTTKYNILSPNFPIMNLIVSGGHTSLYLMKNHGEYELIGKTRDDASGEAFDKASRMLGLGYPGGPSISLWASKIKPRDMDFKMSLPRPMINSKNFDFSFSGLKTALFYFIKTLSAKEKITPKMKRVICKEFQQSVIDVLIYKTITATKKYGAKTIAISGGVSANIELRRQLEIKATENGFDFIAPPQDMSTDNGLMVAIAGYYNRDKKTFWDKVDAEPNKTLTVD